MNNVQTIVKALGAGAAANFRPNIYRTGDLVEDSYLALKEMLGARYKGVDVDVLDIAPGSETRQEQLAAQLEQAGAGDDDEAVALARQVLVNVEEHLPGAAAAAEPGPE